MGGMGLVSLDGVYAVYPVACDFPLFVDSSFVLILWRVVGN